MELSLITNDSTLANLAEEAGIDRIFIDLERLGKAERQFGRGLFLSDHCLNDIPRVRKALHWAKLMVRVDPLHPGSGAQIANVIEAGADLVMLPYFHRLDEAREFLDCVGSRTATVLLVETREAAAILGELTRLPGLSEIHIGLNDLSLSFGKAFLYDLIADGTIDGLCQTLRRSGLPFGFGGISSLRRCHLPVPPELILADQVCQGATRGWLGKTFRETEPSFLQEEVKALRRAIAFWGSADAGEKEWMRMRLLRHIAAH
jgi:citrate lyase beta subunit